MPDFAEVVPSHRLLVLLFSDVVDSTHLKSTLGGTAYASMLRRHNALVERAVADAGGRVWKHTGDGYLASFSTASDAVRAALRLQRDLAAVASTANGERLATRVGINLGQVEMVHQAGHDDLVGLAADLAARVMSLAVGGQILLTRPAFDDARQYVREVDGSELMVDREDKSIDSSSCQLSTTNHQLSSPLRWLAHGPYLFKGSPDPVEVFEVGREGLAPLAPPASTEKARRIVRHDEEPVLGWRPSVGDRVPAKPNFVLDRKLGEGGFGEVWLAHHEKLSDARVFKFCFNADRLRSLKREFTLFRLLKEALGDRPDIVRLHDYNLESPPFYLESEYTAGGNLLEWSERQGGIDQVPLATRLELFAKIADAVAAAHSVGILHKDIKPANILIHEEALPLPDPLRPPLPVRGERVGVRGKTPSNADAPPTARPLNTLHPRLADFGIGFIADRTALEHHQITEAGFTQMTEMAEGGSSRTGTRLYAAPEAAMNRPFTTQGDVFALGVLLYQLVVGDLERPLTAEWREDVADELLAEDIAAATAREPTARTSAAAMVERTRTFDARQAGGRREHEASERSARRQRRRRLLTAASIAATVLLTAGGLGTAKYVRDVRASEARTRLALDEIMAQKAEVDRQRAESQRQRENAEVSLRFVVDDLLSAARPERMPDRAVRDAIVKSMIEPAAAKVSERYKDQPQAEASIRRTLAATLRLLGRPDEALPHADIALGLARRTVGPDHYDTLAAANALAVVLMDMGRRVEAESVMREAMDISCRTLGLDHPETIGIASNYGNALRQLGRYAEAEPFHRDSLDRRRRLLGPNDPATIGSLVNLVLTLRALERHGDAEPLAREAVERSRRVSGDDHPVTLSAMSQLAFLTQSSDRPDEALALRRELLERRERLLGAQHPQTLAALHQYATTLDRVGRHDEAEPLHRGVVENMAVHGGLGLKHPTTVDAATEHACCLDALDRPAEATAVRRRFALPDDPTSGPASRPADPAVSRPSTRVASATAS